MSSIMCDVFYALPTVKIHLCHCLGIECSYFSKMWSVINSLIICILYLSHKQVIIKNTCTHNTDVCVLVYIISTK